MTNKDSEDPFLEMASRFLDGVASHAELEELVALLEKDESRRAVLAELLNQHGTLVLINRAESSFARLGLEGASRPATETEPAQARPGGWIALPIAACFALILGVILVQRGTLSPSGLGDPARPGALPPSTSEERSEGRSVKKETPGEKAVPRTKSLSFQDGVSPSASYHGTRVTRLASEKPGSNLSKHSVFEVEGPDPVLMGWDLTAIPAGSRVLSGRLVFQVEKHSGAISCTLYELKRPWSEQQATWLSASSESRWQAPGAGGEKDRGKEPLARFTVEKSGEISVPLNGAGIALLERWIRSPSSNDGFLLVADRSEGEFYVHAREASSPQQRPELRLSVTSGGD